MQTVSRWHLFAIIIGCIVVFGACSFGGSTATMTTTTSGTGTTTTTTTITTTTSTTTSGSTPVPITPCSTIVSGYGPASGGSLFGDVPFPANSSSTSVTLTHAGNSYTFAIYGEDVCTAGSSAATVRAFFAAQLPATGFAQSNTFPFDGLFEAPCGDPYCWASPHARYVGLESVTDHGSGLVTYHLRFAFPPAAPSCSGSGWLAGYYYKLPTVATFTNVPLPPLTRIRTHTPGPYDPSSTAAYDLCAPMFAQSGDGEGAMITFMTAHGWSVTSPGLNFLSSQGTIMAGEGDPVWTFFLEA
jgi:hypothetical protein